MAQMRKEESGNGTSCEPYQYLYKIVVIGDAGVGKSCLLQRFADSTFDEGSASTIGVDFRIQSIRLGEENVKLQIWDSAGQERYRTVASSYYRGAHGVGIVFDVTQRESFQNVEFWMEELERVEQGGPMQKLLIGNKCDLDEKRRVSKEEAEEFASEMKMKYIETSAKTAENVAEAFTTVTQEIYDKGIRMKGNGIEIENISTGNVTMMKESDEIETLKKKRGCC